MKSKGLNVIGINFNDTQEDVQTFRKEFKLTMPLILGGGGEESVSRKYGVAAYPTNYVIDSEGVVIAQIIGGNMDAIKAAISQLGVTD